MAAAVLSTASWACDEPLPTRGGITAAAGGDRSIEITSERDGKVRVYVDDHEVPVSVKGATATIDITRGGEVRRYPMQALDDGTAVMLTKAQIKHGDNLRVVVTLANKQQVVSELRYTGMNPVAQATSSSTRRVAKAP